MASGAEENGPGLASGLRFSREGQRWPLPRSPTKTFLSGRLQVPLTEEGEVVGFLLRAFGFFLRSWSVQTQGPRQRQVPGESCDFRGFPTAPGSPGHPGNRASSAQSDPLPSPAPLDSAGADSLTPTRTWQATPAQCGLLASGCPRLLEDRCWEPRDLRTSLLKESPWPVAKDKSSH